MERINDSILNCSIYLYASRQDAIDGEKTGGSGFIVGVDSLKHDGGGFFYAVTNSHVVREGKSTVIRVNTQKDNFEVIETHPNDWHHHPNGDDLAIIPFTPVITKYRLLNVPSRLFVTKQIMDEANIGAGDEVFMVGRFIGYDGKQKNEPIVRFGNLAMTTLVPIEHERGITQESLLVETRSLPGFSGSPMFTIINTPNKVGEIKEYFYDPHGEKPYLLGVDWGHKYTYEKVLEKNTDEPVGEGWRVKTNSGISCVVPAWKLQELLDVEELVEMRKKYDEKIDKSKLAG